MNFGNAKAHCAVTVAAGVSPAVEPGVSPGGSAQPAGNKKWSALSCALLGAGGETPPSTAGEDACRYARRLPLRWCFSVGIFILAVSAQAQTAQVQVVFSERLDPMAVNRMALGQGGLSEEPMWAERIPEVRALHPQIIRLFIQEYFDLLPEQGRYHFVTLDRSVDTILATGAKPLMCICFKPKVLFPSVDQDVVEPNDYSQWEALISSLVRHYKERGAGIRYWEVANEPDIGEDGGCPYRFKPDSYARYYQHTAAAIRQADSEARVGGPALAGSRSPLLPALLALCQTKGAPLDFVSWHIYSSDPQGVRGTITYVKDLLKRYPALKPETFLDEWNMDLMNPPLDPRFQPCYIAEVIWNMKEAGLDYSCYYHIRDWYVSFDRFAPFMSRQGTAFMARWWNRMPQFDGLFDYQNRVRPSYFAFKLLSRLAGERLRVSSSSPTVHAFASTDEQLRMDNLLLWNYSSAAAQVEVQLKDLSKRRTRHIVLDALGPSDDENARLRPEPFRNLQAGDQRLQLTVEPWAIHYWSFE
jgi:xylan 1,4-beta-xylosidase